MKLDPPRPKNKETERALFENLRNFLYEKQKVGNFSLNSERNKPKIVKIKKLVRNWRAYPNSKILVKNVYDNFIQCICKEGVEVHVIMYRPLENHR